MAKQRDNTAEKKPLPKEIGMKMPPERSILMMNGRCSLSIKI